MTDASRPAVDLELIEPHERHPKGIVPYSPRSGDKFVGHVLDSYRRLKKADALPVGPRQTGYRLKEKYSRTYTKESFPAINNRIKRLTQADAVAVLLDRRRLGGDHVPRARWRARWTSSTPTCPRCTSGTARSVSAPLSRSPPRRRRRCR